MHGDGKRVPLPCDVCPVVLTPDRPCKILFLSDTEPMNETQIKRQHLLLANAAESREADRLTIESFGIPGDTLMEIAGNKAAEVILSDLPVPGSVLFVCGKGNNAGDALVIARILLNEGYRVHLYPVFGTDGFSPDAKRNYDRLLHLAEEMQTPVTIWDKWHHDVTLKLIVDGIFGTGLVREVRSPVLEVITDMNSSGCPVYAMDIPTGLDSDTGEVNGCAVRAQKTIQFGIQKAGCYLGDGPYYSGIRTLAPLPFPVIYKKNIRLRLVDLSLNPLGLLVANAGYADTVYADGTAADEPADKAAVEFADEPAEKAGDKPGDGGDASIGRREKTQRKNLPHKTLHKYNNGVVHVIGGSTGITGAPIYAAKAAWSSGMGAVSLLYPSAWAVVMETLAPSLIKKPVGDAGSQYFTEKNSDEVLRFLFERPGVVIIGPGLGRHEQTLAFARRVISGYEGPMIIDADALRCIHGHEKILSEKKHPGEVILTPHPGELSHIANKKPESDASRLGIIKELGHRLGAVILGKGNPVFVHSPATSGTLVTPYDTSAFSRAGFGDTLAGHIAAFLARTNDPVVSCENALVHGYNKLKEITSSGKRFPEPSDFS